MFSEYRQRPAPPRRQVERATRSPSAYSIREALDDRRTEGMRQVVIRKWRDTSIRNKDAARGNPVRSCEHQWHDRIGWNRTLCCARRHRAMGTAYVAVSAAWQRLAATSMGYRIANAARSERRRVGECWPLQYSGKNHCECDQAAMHGVKCTVQAEAKNVNGF